MSRYKRGDVVVVEFPYTDFSGFKRRPALIISNNIVNFTGDYIMLQITTSDRDDDLGFVLTGEHFSESRNGIVGQVRLHKTATVNQRKIIAKRTAVTDQFVNKIVDILTKLISSNTDAFDDEGESAR